MVMNFCHCLWCRSASLYSPIPTKHWPTTNDIGKRMKISWIRGIYDGDDADVDADNDDDEIKISILSDRRFKLF